MITIESLAQSKAIFILALLNLQCRTKPIFAMKSKSSRSYFTGSRCRILFLACLISNIVLLQFFILEHFSRKEEDKTLFEFSSGGKYGDNGMFSLSSYI